MQESEIFLAVPWSTIRLMKQRSCCVAKDSTTEAKLHEGTPLRDGGGMTWDMPSGLGPIFLSSTPTGVCVQRTNVECDRLPTNASAVLKTSRLAIPK